MATVATPKITPIAGPYKDTISVALSCATPDVNIYYTTDGSTPDATDNLYVDGTPIVITSTTTIKAIGIKKTVWESVFDVCISSFGGDKEYFYWDGVAYTYPDYPNIAETSEFDFIIIPDGSNWEVDYRPLFVKIFFTGGGTLGNQYNENCSITGSRFTILNQSAIENNVAYSLDFSDGADISQFNIYGAYPQVITDIQFSL